MDAAASDPFFLDWGSSVNVNEDLRRTIRTEIEGIDSDIKTLQSSVKAEERMSAQLTKDFAHARAELINLSRGATDDRDNSIMNEQIQLRLRDSLMTEVVSVITPTSSPEKKTESTDSNSFESDDQMSPIGVHDSDSNSSERHLGKYLSKCAAEVKSLTASMQEKKLNLEDHKSKLTTIQYQIDSIMNQIDRDQKTQITWSDDADEKRREFDVEKQRIRCVKDAIQRARKLNGQHAQRLANDSKVLSLNKSHNAGEETRLEIERKSIEDHVRKLTTELSTLLEADSELSSQVQNLTKQFVEREGIMSRRLVTSKLYDEKQRTINEAKKKEEVLLKELSEVKKAFEDKETRLLQFKKQKNEVDQLRSRNDKEEQEILAPSKNEYLKLLEEKEALAKTITELHDCSASEKQSLEEKQQSNTVILSGLDTVYHEKLENFETKKNEMAKMKEQLDELNAATNEEIEEHNKLAFDLSEALEAQRTIVDENKQLCHKRVEMVELEWSQRLKHSSYEVDILKQGADIITKTKETEYDLMKSQIDGEDN